MDSNQNMFLLAEQRSNVYPNVQLWTRATSHDRGTLVSVLLKNHCVASDSISF